MVLCAKREDATQTLRYARQVMPTRSIVLQLAFMTLMLAYPASAQLPRGWTFFTTNPTSFEGGRDVTAAYQGSSCGMLRSVGKVTERRHALLLQKIDARAYRGQRVKLSAWVSADEVVGWGGIWLRVDDKEGVPLSFDNMMERPIRGTSTWSEYSIEMEVAPKAREIHFGLLLSGQGTLRVDSLNLVTAGPGRPAEKVLTRIRSLPSEPVNTGFEK